MSILLRLAGSMLTEIPGGGETEEVWLGRQSLGQRAYRTCAEMIPRICIVNGGVLRTHNFFPSGASIFRPDTPKIHE